MFKLFKNFSKKDMGLIVISISLIVVQVWLELKMPDYMTEITKLVQTKGSSMNDILVQGGYMLLCAGGSLVSAIIVGYLALLLSATFSCNIRSKIFNKVQSFTMEEINKFSTSSLITRTTNDITQVEMFIAMGLQMLIKSPIMAIWAIMKILGKGWQWSVATGVAVFVLLLVITILILVVLPKFKIVQKLIDNINELARENLKGIRVVRAFNAEEYQENKFAEGNKKLTETQLFTQRMMAVMQPTINLVMHGLTLSIYFIGAYLINEANMMDKITLFSNMVVFSSYSMQVIMSFLMLALIFIMYPRTSVAADRINEVLDTESKIKDGDVTSARSNVKVEFKNVSFKYPDADEYILKDISFKVNLGETVAFIGSTGSGKSTLINLVPRFYDVTSGSVLIDGINVKDYNLEYLHNKLGYVPQHAVLFNATVKENVEYGESGQSQPTEKEIIKALEIAQAKSFVEKMTNKYDSKISEGGTNISGGQKQRISIARAIARKPEILIFDDSFSALDYKTDYLLRHDLKKYTKNITNLIVAQRIGTIINADKIIVLDEGKCVGIGTHKELLKKCHVYKEIAYSQLTKEELEDE